MFAGIAGRLSKISISAMGVPGPLDSIKCPGAFAITVTLPPTIFGSTISGSLRVQSLDGFSLPASRNN
jgi:hypothetical protein